MARSVFKVGQAHDRPGGGGCTGIAATRARGVSMPIRRRARHAGLAVALLAAALGAAPARARSAPPPIDKAQALRTAFGNDAPWYENNVPLFESADPLLQQIYYYRWQVFRAHQRDLGQPGYITTEFLDDVGWQREPYASLNDATGFHIGEGRWLRDRRYTGDYIDFMYEGGGNDRHFSEAIADATFQRFLADGDLQAALKHLPAMKHVYGLWDDRYDLAKKLYWIEPLLDATEYTIASIDASGGSDGFTGGQAFRPSINSYMFANARAIARLSELAGDAEGARLYEARAGALRERVQDSLWSPGLGHFIDRYRVDNQFVKYWQPIRGRELVGYVPWTFGLPADEPRFAESWRHLLSPTGFAGRAGLRTVEPTYEFYMRQYRYDQPTGQRECQWNGPIWPFQTTQVLTGMANLLHDYRQSVVTRADYVRLLRQYAQLHYRDGRPDLEEDYDPETGRAIVGLARSHHYNHSGFVDLIVTGLVGLLPREDDVLEVNPLVPADPADPGFQRYFALQDVPYHGRLFTILWDADGSRYARGAGLIVLAEGHEIARAATLGRLTVPLSRRPAPPIEREVNLAVELVRGDFPKPSASINADPAAVHDAVDGRVWFFPELVNGWSTAGAQGEAWFAVDLGQERPVRGAELAFFADGKAFRAPASYRLQLWRNGRWQDAPVSVPAVENGVTHLDWPAVPASKARLLLRNAPGAAARLVELKLF